MVRRQRQRRLGVAGESRHVAGDRGTVMWRSAVQMRVQGSAVCRDIEHREGWVLSESSCVTGRERVMF